MATSNAESRDMNLAACICMLAIQVERQLNGNVVDKEQLLDELEAIKETAYQQLSEKMERHFPFTLKSLMTYKRFSNGEAKETQAADNMARENGVSDAGGLAESEQTQRNGNGRGTPEANDSEHQGSESPRNAFTLP